MYAYMGDDIKRILRSGNRELINKLIHGEDVVVYLPEEVLGQNKPNSNHGAHSTDNVKKTK